MYTKFESDWVSSLAVIKNLLTDTKIGDRISKFKNGMAQFFIKINIILDDLSHKNDDFLEYGESPHIIDETTKPLKVSKIAILF